VRSVLGLRVASAAVLAPLAIGAVLLGGWAFALLVLAAAVILAWEWRRLLGPGGPLPLPATVAAVWAVAAFAPPPGAIAVLLVAAAVQAASESAARARPAWAASGVLYVGLPVIALLWLRGTGPTGAVVVLWLMAVVWATDIGAYAAGRLLGGPKLAPAWSPNKTWAGALGGIAAAAGAAAVIGALGYAALLPSVLTAAGLSVVAQAGDLAESVVKRRFGVKDMGTLIPGHGGLFDRLDSMLAAAPILALFMAAGGGEAGLWQATSGG